MSESHYLDKLRAHPLFASLSPTELQQLLSITQEITLNSGDVLIEEGSVSDKMYFILSGELLIYKKGSQFYHRGSLKDATHEITHIKEGEMIGDIAFFDKGKRSASAKALIQTKLLAIPYDNVNNLAEKNPHFYKMLLGFCRNISTHLRHTNEVTVSALERSIAENNMRITMSMFMINIVIAFCLFSFLLSGLNFLGGTPTVTSLITLPMTLFFLILIYSLIRSSNLPWRLFGLTTHHWKKSLLEVFLTMPIMLVLVVVIKILLIKFVPDYQHHAIFEPYKYVPLKGSKLTPIELWCVITLAYALITAPVQELIVRGGLQSSLEYFLVTKRKSLQAILISNIIFSTMHLFISFQITFLVFFGGLYFGWLYSRTKTLIGVIVAHALLGTWLLAVVGI